MKYKILKRLSNKIVNSKKIFAFDVETYHTDEISPRNLKYKRQEFLMGSVVGNGIEKTFWNKKEMQKFLISDRELRDSLIFATNLDFDFNILYDDYNLKDFKFIERNGSFIIISYREYYNNDKYHQWKFLDTMNYSRLGVQNLGKMLGLEKLNKPGCLGKKDLTKEERKELINYNLKDSYITYKFAEFMQNFCNDMKCKLKPTIASIGIDYWRRNFLKKDIFQERREIIDKHFQGSMKGGRTENFKRGLFKDAYYYDYNSHYPAICKDGVDNNGKYPNPSSVRTLKNVPVDYIDCFDGISLAEIEIPYMYIPLLGYHSDSKLYFPIGRLKGWWTNIELQKAVKLGYKINKIEEMIYYTKHFVPFKDCVKTLYDLRLSYKREGNNPMEQLIKVLMNSGLFGKFAQKLNNKTEVYEIKSMFVQKDGKVYIKERDKIIYLYDFQIRGNYVFENIEIPLRIPVYIMPILASYTTAMARIKLFDCINKNPKETIYCDTDSLVVKRKLFESSNALGKLKLEYKIKEGIFCRPKQYYINNYEKDIVRVKGVRNQANNKDSFLDLLKNGTEYMRFTKIKESAIRKLPYGSIINVSKQLGLEDDKRLWKNKFDLYNEQDSKPLKMIL